MTQTATSPSTTIISTLPHQDTPQANDRLLCIEENGTLKQLLAHSLFSQGAQGPTGPKGESGKDGKDATAPPLAIFPYYDDTPPDGYLFLQGQNFNASTYPLLAQKFPSGTLPDFRSRVARGAGNLIALGEVQEDAIQNISGSINAVTVGNPWQALGCFSEVQVYGDGYHRFPDATGAPQKITFDASLVARTADETRVKAIGVNFVIKAA
ncbi:tail fiber protein [Acetobacteraceae bacterium]|nr:tail fiber protein [Acetobacteraceae bacterium]